MKVNFEKCGTTLRAILLGELDQHSAREVREEILMEIGKGNLNKLVLDLRSLSFMDSSGIGVFIGAYHSVHALDGVVEVWCEEGIIQRMVTLSGLSKLMKICVGGEYE